MAEETSSLIKRLIARVRWRLFVKTLAAHLMLCWTALLFAGVLAVLGLTFFHFRSEPLNLDNELVQQRFLWLMVALGAGALGLAGLAWWRLPSREATALSIDERYHLKERLTTAISLPPDSAAPMGHALLRDLQERLAKIDPGTGYPYRLSPLASLVPVGAVLFTLAALFCEAPAVVSEEQPELPAVQQKLSKPEEIARQLQQLKKQPRPGDKPIPRELEQIDAELERIAEKKPTNKEEAREVLKDMTALADRLRKHEQGLIDRSKALREQAQQMDRLTRKKKGEENKQPGPADKLDQAMNDADFKRAQEEAEKLSRELEKTGLNDTQRKELSRELQEMKDRLQKESNPESQRKALEELQKEGGLTPEQLQRELEMLEQNSQKIDKETLEQLQKLAAKLEEAQQALDEGKDAEAGKCMKEAAELMKSLDKDGEGADLAQKVEQLQMAQMMMRQAMGGQQGQASGKRPVGKEPDTKGQDTRIPGQMTPGKVTGVDQVPGMGRKGPQTPTNVPVLVDSASHQAAEVIDRDKLPRADSDLAKGYYERLRNEGKTPPKK